MRAILIAVLTVCLARHGLSQLDPNIVFKGAGGKVPDSYGDAQKKAAETENLRLRNQQLQQQIQQQKNAASSRTGQQVGGQQGIISGQFAPPTGAQFATFGMGNGRMWAALAPPARLTYLSGMRDVVLLLAPPEADAFFAGDFSPAEIAASIDSFYLVPENARIPVVEAIQICIAKFKGGTAASIESATVDARQRAAGR